jgi:hypothetical protein
VPTANHSRSSRIKPSARAPATDSDDSKSLGTDTKEGFDISSSVVGLIILAFSLAFFILDVWQVYPITVVPHCAENGFASAADTFA